MPTTFKTMVDFTFHKNYKPNNDTYLFEGTRYCYFGDVEDKDNRVVAKVYEHENDLIIAVFDDANLYLHEWAELMEVVEGEVDLEVSYMVWEANKAGEPQ